MILEHRVEGYQAGRFKGLQSETARLRLQGGNRTHSRSFIFQWPFEDYIYIDKRKAVGALR